MTHKFIPIPDKNRDKYRMILEGGADESKFGRVFPNKLKEGERYVVEVVVVQDGETRRKAIDIWRESPEPIESKPPKAPKSE